MDGWIERTEWSRGAFVGFAAAPVAIGTAFDAFSAGYGGSCEIVRGR